MQKPYFYTVLSALIHFPPPQQKGLLRHFSYFSLITFDLFMRVIQYTIIIGQVVSIFFWSSMIPWNPFLKIPTQTQLNLNKVGFPWKKPPTTHRKHNGSNITVVTDPILTKTDSNGNGDICAGNICPGNISQYQEYIGCCKLDF